MPYIKSEDGRRKALQRGEPALTAGELNYQIFYYVKHNIIKNFKEINTIRGFIQQFLGEKPNYQKYNDITGVLIRCEKEIERRLNQEVGYLWAILQTYDDEIAKYEDTKIIENGDVE